MKLTTLKLLALFLVVFSVSSYKATDDDTKNKVLLNLIIQGLGHNHFSDIPIDDAFSEKAFDLYLERLDYNKRFLTQDDVDKLMKYRDRVDDQVNSSSFELLEASTKILDSRVKEAESYYKEILAQPFDFTKEEYIETDGDKLDFAKDEGALKERWKKILKYQTLVRLTDQMDIQKKAKEENDTSVTIQTFAQLEQEARGKIKKNHDEWFRRMTQVNDNDHLSMYINALLNVYDPHTSYYPPKDKENFDIAMSGQLEGIGATLQEKEGYIKVMSIVPGSPSYKQGELEPGDVILKVAQGDGEAVDVVDMRLDEAVRMIRGKKGTEVRLTVKKLDGVIQIIPIIRDVVQLEATYAKSAILKKEGMDEKVGYIKLPKFYADFNHNGGRSSADDVRKEIAKLKTENIAGLVLDLRNNGGGSLSDVVEMMGLFIENGPIVQVKGRDGDPLVLQDKDPKVQYDGPLVVMVNEFSASASEILAAAVQDYNRGIVIGSATTHGKGTVQKFVNLDQFITNHYDSIKPLGVIKLTTQKFYRINGGATQLKGVQPDIVLPDSYAYIEVGEKEHDHPMPWSEIAPVPYQSWQSTAYDLNKVREKSSMRIQSNDVFQLVSENAAYMKEQRENSRFSLNLETYKAERTQQKKESEKFEDIKDEISGFNIEAPGLDAAEASADSTKKEMLQSWHKELNHDIHLYEAVSILNELE